MGQKLFGSSETNLIPIMYGLLEPLPKTWQNYLEHAGELMSYIKTYDQQTYEVQVEDNVIKIRI
jgi:hypothetical protein